jgi:hypothetical protein
VALSRQEGDRYVRDWNGNDGPDRISQSSAEGTKRHQLTVSVSEAVDAVLPKECSGTSYDVGTRSAYIDGLGGHLRWSGFGAWMADDERRRHHPDNRE